MRYMTISDNITHCVTFQQRVALQHVSTHIVLHPANMRARVSKHNVTQYNTNTTTQM